MRAIRKVGTYFNCIKKLYPLISQISLSPLIRRVVALTYTFAEVSGSINHGVSQLEQILERRAMQLDGAVIGLPTWEDELVAECG